MNMKSLTSLPVTETNKTQKTCKDPGLSGLRGGGGVHCLTVMSLGFYADTNEIPL